MEVAAPEQRGHRLWIVFERPYDSAIDFRIEIGQALPWIDHVSPFATNAALRRRGTRALLPLIDR